MKTPETLQSLYQRFLDHESTPEELQQLLEHFGTADEAVLRTLIRRELEQDELAEVLPDPAKLSQLFDSITEQINTKKQRDSIYQLVLKIAAALLGALMIFAVYFTLLTKPGHIRYASINPGKLRVIHLPDGSTAMLDAGAVLSYPVRFTSQSRTVTLTRGVAFFDVVHQVHQPFIVKTSTAIITVMGTSFEVAAFSKDKTTRVSVKTGLVGIQFINKTAPAKFLSPGQTTLITKSNPVLTIVNEPVDDIAAWREQKLIFNDQPLGEVMESLERKYNVQIEVQNKALLHERISMRLNNQPLQDILTAISFANHFNYVVNGQLIVVK